MSVADAATIFPVLAHWKQHFGYQSITYLLSQNLTKCSQRHSGEGNGQLVFSIGRFLDIRTPLSLITQGKSCHIYASKSDDQGVCFKRSKKSLVSPSNELRSSVLRTRQCHTRMPFIPQQIWSLCRGATRCWKNDLRPKCIV